MTVTDRIRLLFSGDSAHNVLNISYLPFMSIHDNYAFTIAGIFFNITKENNHRFLRFFCFHSIKNAHFLFKNVWNKLFAAFLLIGVLQFSGFDVQVQAQTHLTSASKNKANVFICNDLIITNAAEIKGNISYVCANRKTAKSEKIKTYGKAGAYNSDYHNFDIQGQTHSACTQNADFVFINGDIIIANAEDIKGNISFVYAKIEDITAAQRIISENTDCKQTELVKNGAKIKKHIKETVYSPLSPLGDTAFINGFTSSNAVLPVQSNHSHKLIILSKFYANIFYPIFDSASKYFTNNNFALHTNGSFACAQGNLPPPSTKLLS